VWRDKSVGRGKCTGTKVKGGASVDKRVQGPRHHGTTGQKCRDKNVGQKCRAGKKRWAGQQCGPKPEGRLGRMCREN